MPSLTEAPVTLTILGCGVLASRIVDGLLVSCPDAFTIRLTTRRADHAQDLRARWPQLFVTTSNTDAALWSADRPTAGHIILIATQPRFTSAVCEDLRKVLSSKRHTMKPAIVTMCPGISTTQVQEWLGWKAPVVRTMPNTPVSLGQGATAMFCSPETEQETTVRIRALFSAVSPVTELLDREDLLDVAAAVSGSAPAYIYLLLDSLVNAGVERGLPESVARRLVLQSGVGASMLARGTKQPLQELIGDVCVPGGSTERAVAVMTGASIPQTVGDAVQASWARNREMAFE